MNVYTARWVYPVASPPISDGCVAVHSSGAIAYVGPQSGAPQGVTEALGNAVLMPGIINAHSHLQLTVLRGALANTGFFEWIRRLVDLRSRFLDAELLRASAIVGIAEGLRAGITTFGDTADSAAPFNAMLELGVRGTMYQEVFGPDPAHCNEAMQLLRGAVERLAAAATPTVRVGISPHAPYTVSDELYREVAAFARANNLPLAVHIAESAQESDYVIRGEGPFAQLLSARGIRVGPRADSPIGLLRDAGVLDLRPLLIHAIRVNDADVAAIKESGAPVVHCPVSNAKLGHGIAPLGKYLDEGITVALGSDSVITNDRMDMLEEARIACLLQRAHTQSESVVNSFTLLKMLTLDGAKALGIDSEVGSLEVGKRADIAAFSLDGLSASPHYDVAEALIHSLRGSDAKLVMVEGKVLFRDGKLSRDISGEQGIVREGARSIRGALKVCP